MAKDKLSDFRVQERNTNKHRPRGMGMLDNVIGKEGWIGAITTAANNETFAGSARLEVAQERFGEDLEPIVFDIDGTRPVVLRRIDIPTADDPRAIRLGIGDNRIQEVNNDTDYEILAAIVEEEVDVSDMYFDDELAALIGKEDQDDESGTEYQAPEVQPNTKGIDYEAKYAVAVECETEQDQEQIFNRLSEMGYKCKVLTL
jgi:hypothetical protein